MAKREPRIERACITCTTAPDNCVAGMPVADVWHVEARWPKGHVKSGVHRLLGKSPVAKKARRA